MDTCPTVLCNTFLRYWRAFPLTRFSKYDVGVVTFFFNNNTMSGATSRLGTDNPSGAHEVTISFFVVRVAQSLFFYIVFSGSLFVFMYFFWRSLYCLSVDLRFRITPLVSWNFWPLHCLFFDLRKVRLYSICGDNNRKAVWSHKSSISPVSFHWRQIIDVSCICALGEPI
jgi:hypothetical protein